MGLTGAAHAVSVSEWISFLMLAFYVLRSESFNETWQGFSKEAFGHVFPGLSLAIPSAVMLWYALSLSRSLIMYYNLLYCFTLQLGVLGV